MMQHKTTRSLGNRIVRASAVVSLAHLLCKLIGLVQVVLVGRYLDSFHYDTIYAFAFEGVILTLFFIGEEAIGPSFLPVFMREFDERQERAAWRFANVVLTIQAILLLIVILLVICFPDAVIRICTAWKDRTDAARYRLARESVVWLAPSLFFLSLGSTTYMILNGYKRFFLAAFGDAAWRICVVLSIVVGIGIFSMDYRAIVFGILAGSAAKLVTHLAGLLKEVKFMRPCVNLKSPAFRGFLLLLLPLLVGILFAKLRDIYSNVYVLSYLETEGLMKANSIGRKIPDALIWLIPYALSIAMFPFLCEMVDRKQGNELGRLVTQSSRMVLSVFLPFAVVCAVLAEPAARLLFHGGETPAHVTRWIGISMAIYMFILPVRAVEQILIQTYFAHRKMVSVTVMGVMFSGLSILISYFGIVVFGARGGLALAVVAAGLVLGRGLKAVAFVGYMKKTVPMFPAGATAVFLARMFMVSVLVGAAAHLARRGFALVSAGRTGTPGLLAELLCAGCAAALAFAASTFLLKIREPAEMLRWAMVRRGDKRAANDKSMNGDM